MSEEKRPFILVVDDDPALQKLVVSLLNRGGIDATSALNAREARLALDREPRPELMLLDLMLPEMSGIEFLKIVREESKYDYMPVIILSALADPEQIREGLDVGADRYLTKPYLANNLIRTVKEVIAAGRRVK